MSEQKPLGAQISHMLKDRGVDYIFGIPGVHNQEMYRGIEEAGITHILARHEQGAGFMADGYARASGQPGVCYVITGPGLCNVMTPLGQAYSDSVPVLCISSCLDETAARRGQLHQMLDQAGAGRTVCDWSETAHSAQAAYALIDRAMGEFFTKRPRSKHITVPIAQLEAPAPTPPKREPGVLSCAAPSKDQLRLAADKIAQSARPLFVFGGGCVTPGSSAHLAIPYLLERSGGAAFVSYAGRGLVAPDHPMFLGSNLARPSSAKVFADADLLITIGSELSEGDLWRDHPGHNCPHIRIDLDPEVLSAHPSADLALWGDATWAIHGLVEALGDVSVAPKWDVQAIAELRQSWRAEVDAERPGIAAIADCLKAAVPEGAMIFSDMTQFAYTAKEVWDMDRPGHWHHPTGFGTLGYALPAAIGGAVARPDLPTLAILGDYGFQYTVQDLGTAVELGRPLPIIIWDNGKLKEIEDSMVHAQIAPNAVIAKNPDFLALARAYGAGASAPRDPKELKDAMDAAFVHNGPTIIHLTPDFKI